MNVWKRLRISIPDSGLPTRQKDKKKKKEKKEKIETERERTALVRPDSKGISKGFKGFNLLF